MSEQKRYEHCSICDALTGRAGAGDGSLYDDMGGGPYCDECWDKRPADVAQPEEQLACTEQVAGSKPAVGSTKLQRWRLKPQLCIGSTGEPDKDGEVEWAWPDGGRAWVSAERFAYRFEPVPDVPETCVWQTVSILPTYLAPSCRPKDDIHMYVARGFTFCPWCAKPIEVKEG